MKSIDENSAFNLYQNLNDFCINLNKAHHANSPQVAVEVVIDALKDGGIISDDEAKKIETYKEQ